MGTPIIRQNGDGSQGRRGNQSDRRKRGTRLVLKYRERRIDHIGFGLRHRHPPLARGAARALQPHAITTPFELAHGAGYLHRHRASRSVSVGHLDAHVKA